MTNSRNTTNPSATAASAIGLVADIARLQAQRAEIIARLAAEVRLLDKALYLTEKQLTNEVKYARSDAHRMAEEVKAAMIEHRVNTGELISELHTVMEARATPIWPEAYRPIKAGYAIVPD